MKVIDIIKPAHNPSLAELPNGHKFQGSTTGNSGTFMKCYEYAGHLTALLDLETCELLSFNSAVVIKDYVPLVEVTLEANSAVNSNDISPGTTFKGNLKIVGCDAINDIFVKTLSGHIIDLKTGNGWKSESGLSILDYKVIQKVVLRNDYKN